MTRDDVIDLIFRTSILLDEERFDEWLELCDSGFTYRIRTYSDELRRPMIWLNKERDSLTHLFTNLDRHERYTGRLRRHVSMVRVDSTTGNAASVHSEVAVYHTELNGVTQLFAIGSYNDSIVDNGEGLKIGSREVILHTRRLPFEPHVLI